MKNQNEKQTEYERNPSPLEQTFKTVFLSLNKGRHSSSV